MSLSQAQDGASTAQNPADATKPTPPPGLALSSGKTADEILADLNKSPLFMTELEDNDDTAALQALAYEGSARENAADFRERGNECFKARGYADAREFYSKAVAVLSAEERKRAKGEATTDPDGVPDSAEEIGKQRAALEAMHVNRAACHLELRNYRSCWTDCAAAIRLNPGNVKAHYRSARALLAVDRIREAADVCARGLAVAPANAGLRAVAADIARRAEAAEARRGREVARQAQKQRRARQLRATLVARGIRMRRTDRPSEMEDARVALVDEDDPRSDLTFPTALLYPLRLELDLIKAFLESHTLEQHLGYVLPPPWDREGAYALAAVTCFVETREGGLLKMGKRVPLLEVLRGGRVEVVDELVRIFVLPASEADAWAKEFKAKRAAEKGGRGPAS